MHSTFAIRFSEMANNLLQTFVNDGRKKFYNIKLSLKHKVVKGWMTTVGGYKNSKKSMTPKLRPKGNVFLATIGAEKAKRRPESTLAHKCVLCWMLWN